jgi:2-dehydro-3-deoxygluconokinase
MARIFTYGEAMLRLSPPGRGRLEEAASLDVHPAGAEVNVAVALASLGGEVIWLSALPNNPLGRRVAAEVSSVGVDISRVAWIDDARLGLFFVEFGLSPRPVTVWYDRQGSAFQWADPDISGIGDGDWLVLSGVTPALGPHSLELTRGLIQAARDDGASICFDVNYRARLWPEAEAREALTPLIAMADLAICSAPDAEAVFGHTGDSEAVLSAFRREQAPEARFTVLTLGADGGIASDEAGRIVRQDAYLTRSADEFGAGDALVAGFLWALGTGGLERAMSAGVALAALKCTVPGDFARFQPDEVESVIAGGAELLR